MEKVQHLKIPLENIKLATKNFSDETFIAQGGFGKVYVGILTLSEQQIKVAVKRLDRQFGQGNREYLMEIQMLTCYRHKNLVSLVGFCDENGENILVYEHVKHGSLDRYLSNSELSWIQRLKISLGAARGLNYLHDEVGPQHRVLHRDIKSPNILLDENWEAKVSDFGLSKIGPSNLEYTFLVTAACGTIGYIDPEYLKTGILTKESDVYSFGVLLFEILCGRPALVHRSQDGRGFLATLAKQSCEQKRLDEIIFPDLKNQMREDSLNVFSTAAYQCLKDNRSDRPTMRWIVEKLEYALRLQNVDNRSLVDVKPRIGYESMDKSSIWKPTEITEPSQCRSLRLPDTTSSAMRVSRLIYTNSGLAILALAANAVHKLWKWQRNDRNSTAKATASVVPQLWQPTSGILMTNVISDTNPEEAVPCFALSKNDSYVMSASGGKISLFNMMTFKTMTTFMPPPPAATFLAFHPQDNNIIAIGMEDSSIQIYNVRIDEFKAKLKGHKKRITGLAFSNVLNVLVSSGADSQLCVWSTEGWKKQTNKHLQIPPGRVAAPVVDTRVQFHNDQTHLLVVHETQIAVYEAPKLEHPKQWVPPETSGLITHATFSCDSHSVYVSFEDGSVGILTASTLRLRCRISSTSYLPSNPNSRVYPLVIAAHPTEANQFALGLTDGGVVVLEPQESEGKWGTPPPPENGAGPSSITAGTTSTTDQAQR